MSFKKSFFFAWLSFLLNMIIQISINSSIYPRFLDTFLFFQFDDFFNGLFRNIISITFFTLLLIPVLAFFLMASTKVFEKQKNDFLKYSARSAFLIVNLFFAYFISYFFALIAR